MKQVLVVHGGDAFATYEEFLTFLTEYEIEPQTSGRGWKGNLKEVLGEGYEVFTPSMPNKYNAKYNEWKIWFEKHIPFLRDDLIVIGHSLGGSFVAKYLAEERFPLRIRATFIISAPYNEDDGRTLVEFAPPESLSLLAQQGGDIFLYHSADDDIVSVAELDKYVERLPQATVRRFADRGHFREEEFPEIVEDIRSLG